MKIQENKSLAKVNSFSIRFVFSFLKSLIFRNAEKPVIKDEKTGVTLEEGKDYEIVYPEDIKNAGEITATVVGKGDYEGSFEIKFNILKRDVTFTSATDSKQYDGNALTNGNVEIT